jgi:hypothetical protein
VVERNIWPPLRRWSARRIAAQNPGWGGHVLERIAVLDSRSGDAGMAGLLDAAGSFRDEARNTLVDLGCQWHNGGVRLRALQILAVDDPERARAMAGSDASATVRRRAGILANASVTRHDESDENPGSVTSERRAVSNQLALFG